MIKQGIPWGKLQKAKAPWEIKEREENVAENIYRQMMKRDPLFN